MLNKTLEESLLACSTIVQNRINEILPNNFTESKIVDAMRYSALSGGKRIRPFLLIICAEIFNIPAKSALDAAVAIELLHTYSLIHDDLPAMDDDDYRRDKLSCHKQFDEATAILAGDALLTYAFEILSNPQSNENPTIRCELISALAQAAGFRGMIGGQMMDLENADTKISKEHLANLHRLKTGELFMASCEMGAIIGRASLEERKAIRYFAHDFGLAFQIRDDILDYNEPKKTDLGKIKKDNASIVDILGLENAKQELASLKEQAINHLKIFGDKARILKDLMEFMATRVK